MKAPELHRFSKHTAQPQMQSNVRVFMAIIILLAAILANTATAQATDQPASRSFRFSYQFQMEGLPAGKTVQIWWPIPKSTAHQTVTVVSHTAPVAPTFAKESTHGNEIGHISMVVPASGQLTVESKYDVVRKEVTKQNLVVRPASPKTIETYLKPSTLVPVSGKHLKLLDDRNNTPRDLYLRVLDHVDYRKDQPGWGRGDTHWVCDSRFGNCTDFHSLFLSMARAKKIPAKFVIGFSIPPQDSGSLKGYHCWAWYLKSNQVWKPVDISEADKTPSKADYFFGNLTADRIMLSTGRDIVLQPPQAGDPLNFFIAPYAEIEGKTVSNDNIKLQHSYSSQAEEKQEVR